MYIRLIRWIPFAFGKPNVSVVFLCVVGIDFDGFGEILWPVFVFLDLIGV